jgi:hypothetical protein
LELFSPRRLKATQIPRKLVGVEDVPHRSLKPWKLGGKLRMLLCRISKVHELLPEQIVESALDTKSPFNAAGGPALLYPDLVKLYAAHAATIKAGLSRAQKTARFPWHDPSARCISLTAYTSFHWRTLECPCSSSPRSTSDAYPRVTLLMFCYGSVPVKSRVVLRNDSKPVRTPANQIVSGAGGRSNGQCAVLAVAWISQAVSSLCKSYAKVWCSRWQNARSAQEKPSSRRYSAPRPAKRASVSSRVR